MLVVQGRVDHYFVKVDNHVWELANNFVVLQHCLQVCGLVFKGGGALSQRFSMINLFFNLLRWPLGYHWVLSSDGGRGRA